MDATQNPPRNGEGATAGAVTQVKLGGGAEARRACHRTVGARPANIRTARHLRRTMTLPEVLLWQQLRGRGDGLRFRRQYPCQGYVIDFACLERRLAIEVDGEAHSFGDRPVRDARRDAVMAEAGYATLRIAARDVLGNLEGVLTHILSTCAGRPLHHPRLRGDGPPPRSGEDF